MEATMLTTTQPMRLLLCQPGADWSTADVYSGYEAAFKALGHDVGTYNLNIRLLRAGEWLKWMWRRSGRPDERPTVADEAWTASRDLVTSALYGDVDWVVVFSGSYLHPDALIMLKRAGKRIALILTESPYEDDRQARVLPYADVAWTNERTSAVRLRRANPNVLYLPHSFDPVRHYPQHAPDLTVPAHDVVFVGTGFQERLEILSSVDWEGLGIDLGLYGSFELLGSRSRLRRYIRGGPTDNARTAALYRRAKIGLNLHRRSTAYSRTAPRIDQAESMNPRAVELAACGLFHISDRRAEVVETFGDLVPTFDAPDELPRLVRRWLDDDAGRQAIARDLPSRVERMTFRRRAEHIAAFLWAVQSGAVPTMKKGVA